MYILQNESDRTFDYEYMTVPAMFQWKAFADDQDSRLQNCIV